MTPADRAHRLIRPEAPWIGRRACTFEQRHLFFPGVGDVPSVREARAICAGCEVRQECLDYALANHETDGIWGGTTPRERRGRFIARLSVNGCGTVPGYRRHLTNHETPCAACKRANADDRARRKVAS